MQTRMAAPKMWWQMIKLDPPSHRGYEQRYSAFHGAKRHAEAVAAFDMAMLVSKLGQSFGECARGEWFPPRDSE